MCKLFCMVNFRSILNFLKEIKLLKHFINLSTQHFIRYHPYHTSSTFVITYTFNTFIFIYFILYFILWITTSFNSTCFPPHLNIKLTWRGGTRSHLSCWCAVKKPDNQSNSVIWRCDSTWFDEEWSGLISTNGELVHLFPLQWYFCSCVALFLSYSSRKHVNCDMEYKVFPWITNYGMTELFTMANTVFATKRVQLERNMTP